MTIKPSISCSFINGPGDILCRPFIDQKSPQSPYVFCYAALLVTGETPDPPDGVPRCPFPASYVICEPRPLFTSPTLAECVAEAIASYGADRVFFHLHMEPPP